ncbi:hypothetical protein Btru_043991 [Bulinus truncatus]|nr:hypothetical protein Btru_043991 [Bulinus truncatus]
MPVMSYPIRNELLLALPCYKNTGLEVCLNCSCTDDVTHKWVCCDSEVLRAVVNKSIGVDEPRPAGDLNSEAEADCLQNVLALLSFIGIFVALLLITACRSPHVSDEELDTGKDLETDPSVHLGLTDTKLWDTPETYENVDDADSESHVSPPSRTPQAASPRIITSPTLGTSVEIV